MRSTICCLLAVSAAFLAGSASAALIPDGSFETDISGFWGATGDSTIVNSPLDVWGATEGVKFAAMSTAKLGDEDYVMPGANLPFTTNDAVSAATLETNLGLPAGSLTSLDAVEGSGIVHTGFTAPAGTAYLQFDYEFLTNELAPFPPDPTNENDFAFYSLDGGAPVVFYDAFLGPTYLSGANDYFKRDSDLAQTLTIALGAGPHTIAFGVVDSHDAIYNSGLYVDNVRLAVPEPSTIVLLGIAAAALPVIVRRRRQSL